MASIHKKQRVVVLGGGYGGMIAAARIARSNLAEVTLIDARAALVQRIRNHELLAGYSPATLPYKPALDQRGISFVQGYAEGLDLAQGRVVGRSASGTPLSLGYDALVFALGSSTAASIPGVADYALRLNDPLAIQSAHKQVRELTDRGGRVLVAGGGLTGIEVATELATRFPTLHVILATSGTFDTGYAPAATTHLRQTFSTLGIEVRENTRVSALEARQAYLTDGGVIPFDLCVWNGGFEAPTLAREAGLSTDRNGRLHVDTTLRAHGHPEIFGAGDAAAVPFNGGTLRMGCVTALPMGAHTGENIVRQMRGQELQPFDNGFVIRCISLGRYNGLVQRTNADDTPRPSVVTHRTAALVKELICRMTYEVLRWELRTGLRLYTWPGGPVQEGALMADA